MPPDQTCVNHPDEPTRLSCSACDAPICADCVRPSAVGQKCPSCAHVPRSARAYPQPRQLVPGVAAGLGAAIVGGVVLTQVLAVVRFGSIILSALLGYGIGRAVHWAAKGQRQTPLPEAAAVLGVASVALGIVLATGTLLPSNRPLLALAYLAAGYFAYRGAHG